MKKNTLTIIALVLMAALLMGCGSSSKTEAPADKPAAESAEQPSAETETLPGGWSAPESFEITEEQRAAFEKATQGMMGVSFEPVACLGRQVVAGTNYALLCRGLAIVPDAKPYYTVAYVYADLQGGAELLGFRDLTPQGEFVQDAGAAEGLLGGWSVPEDQADGLAAFEKAMEGLTGVNYVPVQVIGQQIVSGTNYCVIAQSTVVYPDAKPGFTLVTLYKDLNGSVKMTDAVDFEIPGAPEQLS